MRGFTILEVVSAIAVLTVAVAGTFILISQTLTSVSVAQSKLIASYLTQEGTEIVRNIRDSNWLKMESDPNVHWDDNLPSATDCQGSCCYDEVEKRAVCEADYLTQSLTQAFGNYLNLVDVDGDGSTDFYSYTAGTPTKFKRKITISDKTSDRFKVSVEIQWKDRGKSYSFITQEYLYNWKP